MTKMLASKRSYPWTGEIGGRKITFRLMKPEDRAATLAFTSALTHNDVVFLQTDITRPEIVDEWIANIEHGRALVLLALDRTGPIVGYASLYHNELSWTRHQGEMRLFVVEPLRASGIGKHLAHEISLIAEEQKLDTVVAQIPRDLPHLRTMLEKVGFTTEALLTDWLMDADGQTHDLIVMARRLKGF